MANCVKCGKFLDEGVQFCTSCGTAIIGDATNTATQQAAANDALQNGAMAMAAYIAFYVVLLGGDHQKSPFLKFHTNQATVLFLTHLTTMIVPILILAFIKVILGVILIVLFSLAAFALGIIGILNAVNGRMKPLPLIGKFTIVK